MTGEEKGKEISPEDVFSIDDYRGIYAVLQGIKYTDDEIPSAVVGKNFRTKIEKYLKLKSDETLKKEGNKKI